MAGTILGLTFEREQGKLKIGVLQVPPPGEGDPPPVVDYLVQNENSIYDALRLLDLSMGAGDPGPLVRWYVADA